MSLKLLIVMQIPSHQLLAFATTAQARSFSKAADQLGITQSALSQRVANLERELEVTLFIRDPSGPRLTEAGELLLRHCQTTHSLEHELLSRLKKTGVEVAGVLRIGTFSSFLRSALIPTLAPFLRRYPHLEFGFRNYQVKDLPVVLRSGEADFVIADFSFGRSGIVEHVLGREEYVVIEGSKHSSAPDVYLDNAPEDTATHDFMRAQARHHGKYRRSFLGDVYGILDGVEAGLGRAVMSKHIVKSHHKVKQIEGYKSYFRKIILHYHEQPYYSELHKKVVNVITTGARDYLE